MAEYSDEERHEVDDDDSGDETTAANAGPNNSIIGIMRSSVTSILPNSVSKWFLSSPNSSNNNNNNNESANGRHSVIIKRTHDEAEANTPHAKIERRSEMVRRRIEVNDYAEDEDDGDHSDDERRQQFNLLSPIQTDQPIPKRRRIALDGTMLSSRQLIASTPAMSAPRIVNNHYGHSNLYPDQNRKELNYNFYASTSNHEQQNVGPDIIDLIPIPISSSENENDTLNVRKSNCNIDPGPSRSRRVLNIPPTTLLSTSESNYTSSERPSLKRQSISSVKANSSTTGSIPNVDNQCQNDPIVLDPTTTTTESYNGAVQSKFQNGAAELDGEVRQRSVTDSEAEDADTIAELPTNVSIHTSLKPNPDSQRAGLFNMSLGNSRSGSRTSSFGNGLNFYTHLEGRKSLFSGSNNFRNRTNLGNPLNSSTLSLNSLSRRQFNASIYGSTSALSDSRLLNTSSPFYKGNTTYGGAAAYSKYSTSLGSNSRLTPTLIRPTSSLSTLSSSNNSIAAGIVGGGIGEHNPSISGTTKTILDILQSFTTPLSEAKKMASGIRQQGQPPLAPPLAMQSLQSKRLCDDDLHASRAMRLQNVRKPYARETVLIQPKKSLASKELMPPVRELQVPSISQLLQMKKVQTLTERSRQITNEKSNNLERSLPITTKTDVKQIQNRKNQQDYTLPGNIAVEQNTDIGTIDDCNTQQQQQKHINKIKNKIGSTLRTGADLTDESPPIPANLPNIAFPLMAEMPKIDIQLPAIAKNFSPTTIATTTTSKKSDETNSKGMDFQFSSPENLKNKYSPTHGLEAPTLKLEFSKPTLLKVTSCPGTTIESLKKPTEGSTKVNELKSPPILKTGSVLEALKKPIELGKISTNPIETTNPPQQKSISLQPLTAFGNQFKKSSNEWECDTCMIRNKESAQKCIACELPRKGAAAAATAAPSLPTNATIATDSGFKSLAAAQKASKWECEACMTQNDSSRSKCACCEQPKPGSEEKHTKENVPTFSFGATAASKFSFGFNANAPDPAKQNAHGSNHLESSVAKNTNAEFGMTGKGFTFGTATKTTKPPNEGISFRIPTKSNKIESTESKDASDSVVKTSGFNFGLSNSNETSSSAPKEVPATITTTTTCNANTTTTALTTTMSTFATPKVNAFSFGSGISTTSIASTTTTTTTTATTKSQESSPFAMSFQKVASPAVTTATSSSEGKLTFPMFKTTPMGTAATTATTTTTFSAATSTNPIASATVAPLQFGVVSTSATSTTTTIKPMFSFGANPVSSTATTTTTSAAVPATVTATGGVSSSSTTPIATTKSNETVGFQFKNSNTIATTTTKSPFSLNTNSNATFGVFGSPKTNHPQSDVTTAATATTTTAAAAAAPAFKGFSFGTASPAATAAKTESTNLFGFSAPKTTQEESKLPIFGNASAEPKPTTTSNIWPKNTFLFGGNTATETATNANVNANATNEPPAPKLMFGSTKTSASETSATSSSLTSNASMMPSIYGNVGATASTSTFGNSGNASAIVFGSNANSAATAAATTNTNIFGSNNNSAAPQFGASTIGSAQKNTSAANAAPAFGSSASIGFGSFGAPAVTTIAASTTNNQQQAPPAYAFGAQQSQPPANSGFNFGATPSAPATRPAFNFSTNQATFNFSGGSSETTQTSTRPFQFGATAAPSVNASSPFSFGGAPSTETTSNTPFQFNAGSSQANSNIFAPTPSATPTTQAARRKVRIPNRRLPPR